MDTAEVKLYAAELKRILIDAPQDSSISRQLNLANKYLLACSYYEGGGWSWAVKSTGLSLTKRLYAAADLLKDIIIDPANPLYYKSLYLKGRIYYWLGKEDSYFFPDTVSKQIFALLSSKFPGHPVLQMYVGKQVPFNTAVHIEPVKGAPLWAVYQREAMHRMQQVIHWWVNQKQALNGELGGKYGDDVEILRWWLPAILGADDSTAALGYTRLADGVWNSGLLERGFSKKVDDVEHSAELFRDTHPAMFLIKYGDPEYVERCMLSMQNFKDVWTGITPHGHRHFKSYYLSASEVLEDAPFGVDVPLNARAVLPGLWLAWYNKNPTIIQSFEEWCNAWVEDSEREENGKPAGVFPAAITFKSDKIGGYTGAWYDADLTYSYYKWESLGHIGELYSHLLGMYALTQNKTYLQPLMSVVNLLSNAGVDNGSNNKPGSLEWVKTKLAGQNEKDFSEHPLSRVFSMSKKITGDTAFDNLVIKYGQPYSKYEISKNKNDVLNGFEPLLNSLRYNLPLLTSEVKFTDRVYVPGSNLLLGMYTGHFGGGFEYPALVATWKNTGPDVAVFVHSGDHKSAKVSLFNAGDKKQVTMRTWLLEPGLYNIKEGIDDNDDGIADKIIKEQNVALEERVNSINIDIPSKKSWVVSIEQTHFNANKSFRYPDLALTRNDISLPDSIVVPGQAIDVKALIHNIGNLKAEDFMVQILVNGNAVDSVNIDSMEAPNDLHPKRREVKFRWLPVAGGHIIGIKIVSKQKEITRLNNYAFRSIKVNGIPGPH